MPKKKKKKRKSVKKIKKKIENNELIFKAKKDWVSKATVNNKEYQAKDLKH